VSMGHNIAREEFVGEEEKYLRILIICTRTP
jgi:hypothetical protein